MKALSLWQPWASLVGIGKNIETRSWATSHRGPILIHAAKRFTAAEVDLCETSPFYERLKDAGFAQYDSGGLYMRMNLPLGAIVAKAELYSCVRTEIIRPQLVAMDKHEEIMFGNFEPRRWAWVMHDIQVLKVPIPYRRSGDDFTLCLYAGLPMCVTAPDLVLWFLTISGGVQ